MANPLWYALGAILVAELYSKYTTPQEKHEWENKIKAHHGEVGALASIVGLLTKSPRLTAVGLGLMAHDWNDHPRWFNKSDSDIAF